MDGLMWFCVIGSMVVTILGMLWFLVGIFSNKSLRAKMPISPLNGLFIAIMGAFFLIFINRNIRTGVNGLDIVLTTILNIIDVFTGESGLFDTREVLSDLPIRYRSIMWTYTAIIHLIVPLLVAGFVLSFLKGFFARIRYRVSRKKEICFFSELNERTILLAEDIKRNRKQEVLLVFCANYDEKEENILEWKSRAEAVGGICLHKDISTINIPHNAKEPDVHFFLLEDSEENNLRLALELADKYKDKQKITLHVCTKMPEAEDILDSVDKGSKKIKMRLIHDTRTMIYNLMDEVPLFLGARENGTRNKKISVLIIGGGQIGLEALKAACWCGQVAKHCLDIHVVDMDEYTESRFLNQCPGFTPYMNESNKQDECFIKFHCINVQHKEFHDFLVENDEIGYVICALGDEKLNLHTATDIRCIYERMGRKTNNYGELLPLINVLVNDPLLHEVEANLKNAQNQEYQLNTFGNMKEIYTWKLIAGTYLDQLAYGVHRIYDDGNEEEARERFESSEYNRKASMVSALHCKYKLYSCLKALYEGVEESSTIWRKQPDDNMIKAYINYITAVNEKSNRVSEQRVEELAKLEHMRWNMFMLTEGFARAEKEEVCNYYKLTSNHKNLIAKKHPGIVPWSDLDEVSVFVSELKNKPVNLKEEDKKIVRSVPQILWQNANTETNALIRARLLMRKVPPVRHIQFDANGKAKENFTALLVGFKINGQQLLRTLMMNSQFYGSGVSVAVVDDHIKLKRKEFEKKYKTMLSAYDIRFYEMKKLKWTLQKIKCKQLNELKYCVFCKDMDNKNEILFNRFRESNPWNMTQAYFMNGAISDQQLYEYKNMEKTAMAINYNYAEMSGQKGSMKELWEELDSFSRQSCRASADFIVSMYQIAGFDLSVKSVSKEDFDQRVKEELLENLAKTEHLRWNAFHYAMGFTAMNKDEVKQRANKGIKPFQKDLDNKKHACLVSWEALDELSAFMTERTKKKVDYKEADRVNVRNMPRTVELMIAEEK